MVGLYNKHLHFRKLIIMIFRKHQDLVQDQGNKGEIYFHMLQKMSFDINHVNNKEDRNKIFMKQEEMKN